MRIRNKEEESLSTALLIGFTYVQTGTKTVEVDGKDRPRTEGQGNSRQTSLQDLREVSMKPFRRPATITIISASIQ
jgi:hypothetical protein